MHGPHQKIVKLGVSRARATDFGGTAVALITVAANTGGAIVRTAVLHAVSATNIALMVGTTAPASTADLTDATAILRMVGGTGASSVHLPYPVEIPAGEGCWVIGDASSGNDVDLTYDLKE